KSGPQVGIYWLIGRNVVAFAEPMESVLTVGAVKDSDFGHDSEWPKVVKRFPGLRGKEYWRVKRGRVLYRVRDDIYVVFGPTVVVNHKEAVDRIARRFHLLAGSYRAIADMHYDPPPADVYD